MDYGSVDRFDTRHLLGVAKTLRRLYAPSEAPNAAIAHALETLASGEARRRAASARPLAPAA